MISRLIPPLLLLVGCGLAQSSPEYARGNWHFQLPTEDSYWTHEPGQPHYEAFDATRRAWQAAGLGDCPINRLSVTPHDGPFDDGWGRKANGMVPTSTRRRTGMVLNVSLPEAVLERLVVHEVSHACGMRDGVGPDRQHTNPKIWDPHVIGFEEDRTPIWAPSPPGSVAQRATCELQPDLPGCGRGYSVIDRRLF